MRALLSSLSSPWEDATQGDPLAMTLYGIVLFPLIEHPQVLQPWYSADGAMQGTGCDVAACFHDLCRVGLQYGSFPEPASLGWCTRKRISRNSSGYPSSPSSRY